MDYQPIIILANKKGNAWEFANKIYQNLNSNPEREKKYILADVEIKKFSDGEIFTQVHENVRSKDCFYLHDSTLDPQDWFVSLALINDALMRSSASEITNILPYMAYSRQDRMAEPRTPISSSVVAHMINYQADRVITMDLHNPATTGSYTAAFDNLKAFPTLTDHLQKHYPSFIENAVIVAPDVGSAKRAESYSKILGLDVAIAHKKREKAGIVSEMTLIGDVKDKNVLIVDDMIDTAGTLCKAADVMIEKGAKTIYACATHGVLSGNAYKNIKDSKLEKVLITDSIPKTHVHEKIETVSIHNLIAESIYRITHGESISELFRKK